MIDYLAAITASEKLRDDRCRAAEQAHADCIAEADRATGARQCSFAERDAAYGLASDGRQGVYDRAYQDHQDRRATLQRRFGQMMTARGNPDAEHAVAWLAALDAEDAPVLHAEPTPSTHKIRVGGIEREVTSGAFSPIPFDPRNARGERRARPSAQGRSAPPISPQIGSADLQRSPQESETAANIADVICSDPPPGLVADIQAALARTKGVS